MITSAGFRMLSRSAENGFIAPEFCFVAHSAKKHSRPADPPAYNSDACKI
jgi:hypothetical protein